MEEFDRRICYIEDAIHYEEQDRNNPAIYKQVIKLLLSDDESGTPFVALLTEENIKEMLGIDYFLTSKEAIDCVQKLKNSGQEVAVLTPKKGKKISYDMIMNSRDAVEKDDDIENIEHPNQSHKNHTLDPEKNSVSFRRKSNLINQRNKSNE